MRVTTPKNRLSNTHRLALSAGVSVLALGLSAGAGLAQTAQDPEDTTEVEEVVITGIRASLQSSQDIKRNSEVFVDSITAEDIGALPDRSVTEALQRVPGVSIDRFRAGVDPDHFSIEGSGVVVRGLTWVRSELNGRDTFSATNGRGLSFADVPAELLGGVDVFKNQSADMIEGGISGSINLRTRVPFDAPGRVLSASVEASYGDFAEEWTPTYSVLYSDRFDTEIGEFGLLLNYVNSELTARSDGQQISNFGPRTLYSNGDVVAGGGTEVGQVWFPRGAAFRSQIFDRQREGYAAAGQWRSPDRSVVATAQFLRSESSQAWTEHAMEIATDNVSSNGDSQALQGTTLEFGDDGVFTNGIITGQTGWRADQNGADPRTPIWGLQSNNIRRDVEQTYVTSDYGFNVKWTPDDRYSFNFDYQRVDSEVEVFDVGVWNSGYQNASIQMRGDEPPVVSFLIPERRDTTGALCSGPATANCPNYMEAGDSFSDPAHSFTRAVMDHIEESEGTSDAFRADLDYRIDDGWMESVRFGVRAARRDQETRFTTYNWGPVSEQWASTGPVWLDSTVNGMALSDYHETYGFENFMQGDVAIPTQGQDRLFWNRSTLDHYDELTAYALAVGDSWRDRNDPYTGCPQNWVPLAMRCDVIAGTPFRPEEISSLEEINRAAYGMLRFRQELSNGVELSGNIGLRYTRTDRDSEGFRPAFALGRFPSEQDCADIPAGQDPPIFCTLPLDQRDAARRFANGARTANTTRVSQDHWLPSFNLLARMENGLQFRFGFSRALTQPDVGLLRNHYNVGLSALAENVVDGELVSRFGVGNPLLSPIVSTNFDASVEWYFGPVGSLTLSLFHKDLEDVIVNSTERIEITNNGATFDAIVSQPQNADDEGTVRGFELAYQQTYDFLPAPWDGFGLNANYTYVDSEGVRQNTLSATDPDVAAGRVSNVDTSLLPLQGLSEHTANFAAFYEKGPWSARLAYAWRSEFLVTVRDVIVPYAPIMQEDSGQLDGSFFYTVNDKWRIGVQAVNLTNEITRTSQVLNNDLLTGGRSWFMNDRRFTLIARATF